MSDVLKIALSEDFKHTVQQILAAETQKFSELTKISGLSLAEDFVGIELSGEDLSDDMLIGVNFSHANLSNANLSCTEMSSANLSHADLSNADLKNIALSDVNLSNANLSHADLMGADLRGANLTEANFNQANLRAADLREANLSNAVFTDADLRYARFGDNPDLSKAEEGDLKRRGAIFVNVVLSAEGIDDLDERLKRLALEAQQHPPNGKPRQRALAKLLQAIQQSEKLVYPHQGQFQGFYEEIYAEALQRLFAFICEQIDRYNPEKEVLQWVNLLLEQQFFIEASQEILPRLPNGVKRGNLTSLTIEDMDRNHLHSANPQLTPLLTEEVIQCLAEDPEGIFQAACVADNPAANFRYLAMSRSAGYTWRELSVELGMRISTLSSFYKRSLTRFAPRIREYLSR